MSPESNVRSNDRVLILEPVDDKKPLSSMGMTDPELFKKGTSMNKLHAVMDTETSLWSFRYEKGAIPPALKGSFTGFTALKKYADSYYAQRNLKITEVID